MFHTVYAAESKSQLIERGDLFFAIRGANHVKDMAIPANAINAINLYTEAYEAGETSAELIVKIMRSSYFYITYTEGHKDLYKQPVYREENKKNKVLYKKYVTQAIEIGEAGLKTYPENAAINYWLAALWGRWSKIYGRIASSKKNVVVKIKNYAEKTIELDPSYEAGGGYRTLGRLHFKTPRIPFLISWPRKKIALDLLEKAVKEGPENLTNHLFYAEALIERGRRKEAEKELLFILNTKTNEETIVEELRAKRAANDLMTVVRDKDDTKKNREFGRI